MRPAAPLWCPLGDDEKVCRVRHHDWRRRRTGPEHPLAVFRCHTHGRSFTVYPPGYVPYARKPWVRLAPDGTRVSGRPREGTERFEGTAFDAARDATRGVAWNRCQGENFVWCPAREAMVRIETSARGPAWSTQGRHVDRAMDLLGLGATTPDDARVERAELLGLEMMVLEETRAALGRGYRGSGRAVCRLLETLDPRGLDDRLAEAGFRAGLWGVPLRWDPEARQLRRMPFRGAGTGPPRGDRPRARGDP